MSNQYYSIKLLHNLSRRTFFPLEGKKPLYLVVILLLFNSYFLSFWRNFGLWQVYIDLTRSQRLALLQQWIPELALFLRLHWRLGKWHADNECNISATERFFFLSDHMCLLVLARSLFLGQQKESLPTITAGILFCPSPSVPGYEGRHSICSKVVISFCPFPFIPFRSPSLGPKDCDWWAFWLVHSFRHTQWTAGSPARFSVQLLV